MKNSTIKTFLRTVSLIYHSSPLLVLVIFVLIVITAVLPAAGILVSVELIDHIAQALMSDGDVTIGSLTLILVVYSAVILFSNLIASLLAHVQILLVEKFSVAMMDKFSQKIMRLKQLSFYENRENLVKISLVRDGMQSRPLNFVYNVSGNLQRIIGLVSMFAVLFHINAYLPFLMFFSTVPVLILSNYAGQKHWKDLEKLQNDKEHLLTYVRHAIDGNKAKDNILFGFVKNFYGHYQRVSNYYLHEFFKISHRSLFFTILSQIISSLITITLFVLMIAIVLANKIGVGAVAGYVQAFIRMQSELQDIANLGRWFFIINGYFENYFSLIDYQEPDETTEPKSVLNEPITHIELKNVSFAYPMGDGGLVLKNLNMVLNNHQRYSIVGKNGSGKTTLIKLLAAFYQPTSGEIIINKSYKLQDLDLFSYRQKLSAVFQDFALYGGFSLDDNIFVREEVRNGAKKTALMAQFDERFQKRMVDGSKMVGSQFGGEDFSGGEQQKLATLRAFLKPSEIIFFDEPTSAIDPMSEKEFIENIFHLSEGKISLVVTHRMGSV